MVVVVEVVVGEVVEVDEVVATVVVLSLDLLIVLNCVVEAGLILVSSVLLVVEEDEYRLGDSVVVVLLILCLPWTLATNESLILTLVLSLAWPLEGCVVFGLGTSALEVVGPLVLELATFSKLTGGLLKTVLMET